MFNSGDYPFLDLLWTMMMFFIFILWIMMFISIFSDVIRRQDKSGFGKAVWVIVLIVLPYLSALMYIIFNSRGMAERNIAKARENEAHLAEYMKSVGASTDPAAQIARGKELLDSGAITQAEFDSLKSKALSAS